MPNIKTGEMRKCNYCGKEIYVAGFKLRRQNKFYCSNQCRANDNPPWNKGLTKEKDKRLDGQVVKMDENFKDKQTGWEGPCPPSHIDCRSSLTFILKE